MTTYKDVIYMVLDKIHQVSDDSSWTEDHIKFLIDKYKAYLIKKNYLGKDKKPIPEMYYDTLCVDLTKQNTYSDICGKEFLTSTLPIPSPLEGTSIHLHTEDTFNDIHISYVSPERMKFVGENKYLQNIIYCTIAPNNHLQFKSSNPQHLYLDKVKMKAIFEDSEDLDKFKCNKDTTIICDSLDKEFKCEAAFIPLILELCTKELLSILYQPEDNSNNSKDDLTAGKQPSK